MHSNHLNTGGQALMNHKHDATGSRLLAFCISLAGLMYGKVPLVSSKHRLQNKLFILNDPEGRNAQTKGNDIVQKTACLRAGAVAFETNFNRIDCCGLLLKFAGDQREVGA